jgi:tetratricopeptide (TPR) repeat protein
MYALRMLGLTFEAESNWPDAEAIHREALATSRKRGGNEDPEALVDLERLARVLIAEKKYGDAEKSLDEVLTPAFLKQPQSENLLAEKINVQGRQGEWEEATTNATLLLQLKPGDQYNYHRLAGLLAMTQNRPGYERICQALPANFANPTSPYVAERMVEDCLLLPHSGVDLELVDKWADASVTLGQSEASLPYFQACKAMSDYRLGRFREAIEWAEKAGTNSTMVDAQAKACAVSAMAHWQLGQAGTARSMLDEGDKLAPDIPSVHGTVDLGETWVAWLMARISLDEAAALIGSDVRADGNSNRP